MDQKEVFPHKSCDCLMKIINKKCEKNFLFKEAMMKEAVIRALVRNLVQDQMERVRMVKRKMKVCVIIFFVSFSWMHNPKKKKEFKMEQKIDKFRLT